MSNRAVVYRTAPNHEHKAAQELREAGARAYVGRDRGSKRSPFTGKLKAPAPGYVFNDRACAITFAKHVGQRLGVVSKAELGRLYIAKPKRRVETDQNPYKPGQTAFRGEIPVKITSTSGRFCLVEWDMLGKRQAQSIHYTQLRPG